MFTATNKHINELLPIIRSEIDRLEKDIAKYTSGYKNPYGTYDTEDPQQEEDYTSDETKHLKEKIAVLEDWMSWFEQELSTIEIQFGLVARGSSKELDKVRTETNPLFTRND